MILSFPAFLTARPAVTKGVKGLQMEEPEVNEGGEEMGPPASDLQSMALVSAAVVRGGGVGLLAVA